MVNDFNLDDDCFALSGRSRGVWPLARQYRAGTKTRLRVCSISESKNTRVQRERYVACVCSMENNKVGVSGERTKGRE